MKGNKIYSLGTCCFVPPEINGCFTLRSLNRGDLPIGVSYHKQTGRFVSRMRRGNKDIHIGIYSTPNEAFINYKKEKESYLKVLADKWKADIDDRAYKALINYKVDETD